MKVYITKDNDSIPTPARATKYSAGYDVSAVIPEGQIEIPPHRNAIVDTGLKIQPEEGYHVELYARSGLAAKLRINLGNGIGLIDRDYKNNLKAILQNNSNEYVYLNNGERIGQLLIKETLLMEFEIVDKLPELKSNRDGGFGSTGV